MKRRGELKLIQQALNNGWDVTPKGRVDAMALVDEVLNDPNANHRELLRACTIVRQMEAADMQIDLDDALVERVKQIGMFLNTKANAKL